MTYSRPVVYGDARELSHRVLAAELPRRWAHCEGVARQARTVGPAFGDQADLLEAAGWLHDIGYAAELVDTGFHPLDGARHLRDMGFGDRKLWTLVAHHTCALVEAEERGLDETLAQEFPLGDVDPVAVAALTYCDMTTGPDGRLIDVERRLEEILTRYGPGDVVHRSITRASPELRAQVAQIKLMVESA